MPVGTGTAVEELATGGTVSHSGAGTAAVVVAVVVGGAVVVVIGAVVSGVAHGSTGAGARCADAGPGTADGVGAGVVVGCANAPAVPESITNATVPMVKIDLAAERLRRRAGR